MVSFDESDVAYVVESPILGDTRRGRPNKRTKLNTSKQAVCGHNVSAFTIFNRGL